MTSPPYDKHDQASALAPALLRSRPSDRALFAALRGRDARRVGSRGMPLRLTYVSEVDGRPVADPTVAFAIGKQFGTAVERNRCRRRIRAGVRQLESSGQVPPGAYLVRPERRALETPFGELVACIDGLVQLATGSRVPK